MKIINLTPHKLNIFNEEKTLVLSLDPSGTDGHTYRVEIVGSCEVLEREFGEPYVELQRL